MQVNKNTARHYVWGGNCDGWQLVDTDSLSVIEERIPPGGGEVLHYHERAQQLFYIVGGVATFEADGVPATVRAGEGYHVLPGDAAPDPEPGDGRPAFPRSLPAEVARRSGECLGWAGRRGTALNKFLHDRLVFPFTGQRIQEHPFVQNVLRPLDILFFSFPIMKFGVLDRAREREGQRPGEDVAV